MTEQEWNNLLESDPSKDNLLLYADWLEDCGESETAAGFRWLAESGKRPRYYKNFGHWSWWRHETNLTKQHGSSLSNLWYALPATAASEDYPGSKDFPTRYAALLAAAKAYGQVNRPAVPEPDYSRT